ncbi:hypothetical protein EJ110_NYTH39958 [Nymphaea thermarum]|nr:hypothetical protein EJ110_NYTH39958 [Nymphaea thermarum]
MPVHSRSTHHPHSISSHSTTKECRVDMRRHTRKSDSIVDGWKCRHHSRKRRGRETTIDASPAHMRTVCWIKTRSHQPLRMHQGARRGTYCRATKSTSHHTFPSTSTTTSSAGATTTHISFNPVLHIVPTLTSVLHPLPTSTRTHPAIVAVITHSSLVIHPTIPITIVVVSTTSPSLLLSLSLCLRLVEISSAHLPQILLGSEDDKAGAAIENVAVHPFHTRSSCCSVVKFYLAVSLGLATSSLVKELDLLNLPVLRKLALELRVRRPPVQFPDEQHRAPQHLLASPEEWIHDAPNSQPLDQEEFPTP